MGSTRDPSSYEYRDLETIEATEERNRSIPTELPLDQIRVSPLVFQPRTMRGNLGEDINFVPELVVELRRNAGEPLTPILVTAIGKHFYCVDGHHRHEAYIEHGWAGPVPVEVFGGTLIEAFVQSWKGNSKPKLNTTASDRTEWAWRLVQLQKMSKREEVQASGCSDGLIGKMRRILKQEGNAVRGKSWWQAQAMTKPDRDISAEDWQEQEAQKLAASLVKHTNLKLALNPEVLLRALFLINDKLPQMLVDEWQNGAYGDDDVDSEMLDI
ncbi:ParB/RepB/Spo0J family partition protein [Methylorubrum extorquens]|uniref:ParB/RepB/Spo0J family partition protein n=1 Tax=Methylorubrum extorquens TaxID=408 RepID=UPI0012DB4690|nr:ParB N-terminal domain-containing protein [Methylorubrum extorquens]